jgi:hypothetical protein
MANKEWLKPQVKIINVQVISIGGAISFFSTTN